MEQERQRRECEEKEFQKPSIPVLCANNCGFFGSSATNNLCSKCHKDAILRNSEALLVVAAQERVGGGKGSGGCEGSAESCDLAEVVASASAVEGPKRPPQSRCGFCNKRLGLMGFSCRCGDVFCPAHRYSDKHGCNYDHKAAERSAIARANPAVKAEKVEKI